MPSPEYPVWQVQWNDPLVLVQLASRWQLSVWTEHSSMSEVQKYEKLSLWEFAEHDQTP